MTSIPAFGADPRLPVSVPAAVVSVRAETGNRAVAAGQGGQGASSHSGPRTDTGAAESVEAEAERRARARTAAARRAAELHQAAASLQVRVGVTAGSGSTYVDLVRPGSDQSVARIFGPSDNAPVPAAVQRAYAAADAPPPPGLATVA